MFGSRYDANNYILSLPSTNNKTNNNNLTMANATQNSSSEKLSLNTSITNNNKSKSTTSNSNNSNKDTNIKASSSFSNNNITSSDNTNNKIPILNNNVLSFKNKLLCDLTRAIQMVQKFYLDKDVKTLTNSDYHVHELCQQFDIIFLYGLKNPDEGYWKFVLDFTHRNVIADLNNLLNIATNFGKGRSWLYHALNDNLMESYLKCILDNKKLVLRFYKKDASLMSDDQAISVLVTLVAGLENIEFKLHNDVPYLDHSCWPTHLNYKRFLVDSILNASSDSLTQIVANNSPIMSSSMANESKTRATSLSSSSNHSKLKKKINRKSSSKFNSSSLQANNSNNFLENSTASSVNNLSDINSNFNDLNDESSETSGRFTAKTLLSPTPDTSPNNQSGLILNSNIIMNKHLKSSFKQNQNEKLADKLYNNNGLPTTITNNNRKSSSKNISHITKKSSKNGKKFTEINFDDNDNELNSNDSIDDAGDDTSQDDACADLKSLNSNISNLLRLNDEQEEAKIDNEIKRLRKENSILVESSGHLTATNNKQIIKQSLNANTSSASSMSTTQDLVATSLKASNHFDEKIQHLEKYSNIIENATSKMDECVKDMTNVYQNYDNIYSKSPSSDNLRTKFLSFASQNQENTIKSNQSTEETKVTFDLKFDSNLSSVYDQDEPIAKSDENTTDKTETSIRLVQKQLTNEKNSNETELVMSEPINCENNYLANDMNAKLENILDIKVDNNLKLMLMIDIFQDSQNEELIKFFHATKDHSQGEIEAIYLMITSHGIYILNKNESSEANDYSKNSTLANINNEKMFKKEAFIHHNQLDFIEVSLGDQAVHFVCRKKIHSIWITTACRNMTNNIIKYIHQSRKAVESLKLQEISVFRESMQQLLALKKFISNEENQSVQNIEIKNYSLVYWEDQVTSVSSLIHKEGPLSFLSKNSSTHEWKRAYFVLKNDVLTQFKSPSDKRPTQVIKLNGEDFSGCRKSLNSSKQNTIELILSNANKLYLSAKNEAEASDWLQCFCKIISLGNYHTDVPTHSCLPCCSVLTSSKLYFCHEDMTSGFYRLLESIKLQEINRISFDSECPYFCILHDDYENKTDNKKLRYWFIYFTDENERNIFITSLKQAWETLFQVPFTIEKCKSSEMRKRCIRGVNLVHKYWNSPDE